MREICTSGSEGGGAFNPLSLPLSSVLRSYADPHPLSITPAPGFRVTRRLFIFDDRVIELLSNQSDEKIIPAASVVLRLSRRSCQWRSGKGDGPVHCLQSQQPPAR